MQEMKKSYFYRRGLTGCEWICLANSLLCFGLRPYAAIMNTAFIFFSPSGYPINSIFQWPYLFIGFIFLMKHFFFLTIRMPMVTNFFGVVTCCEELSPINMHDVLWGDVTNKIHISTYRRCIDTTLGKVLTCVRGFQI